MKNVRLFLLIACIGAATGALFQLATLKHEQELERDWRRLYEQNLLGALVILNCSRAEGSLRLHASNIAKAAASPSDRIDLIESYFLLAETAKCNARRSEVDRWTSLARAQCQKFRKDCSDEYLSAVGGRRLGRRLPDRTQEPAIRSTPPPMTSSAAGEGKDEDKEEDDGESDGDKEK